MATAGEEHGTVSLMFSDYCTSLEKSARSRYKEKCRKCGFDPYALKPSDFDADLNGLPKVEYPDIVNYLVLQTRTGYQPLHFGQNYDYSEHLLKPFLHQEEGVKEITYLIEHS